MKVGVQDTTLRSPSVRFARQKREEFSEAIDSRLKCLDRDLIRLDHQASDAGVEIRCRWMTTRAELIRKRNLARQKLSGLASEPVRSWPEIAQDIDEARQDLASAIAHARSEFQLPR